MKRILVTNDDGFESEGLKALVEALRPLGQVTVVAPTTEKSACGHSLTLTRPLRFVEIDDDFFKLDDGTPSDCIYLSKYALFEEDKMPDLVVSGINNGSNMGEDITYSGTASAAMEAVLQGIPAIAISQVYKNGPASIKTYGYTLAQKYAHDIAKKILDGGFPLQERRFLNINIPPIKEEDCKGVKITHAGYKMYGNDAHLHRNPRGEEYYWIGTHVLEWKESKMKSCDLSAIEQNYVSITPIKLDMSSYDDINTLNEWIENG
ncbi:5'/3'-nucleotidase SurE [Sulfurospirillum arcachonense]|uniref:5'/3'-nucleotidase SurE n=1 Tax=Sulfurospirillum arcachonense TaxID=57666 RepID=UPI000469F5AD|nr:5'/3'-nucleotidase SurE [Sulfurospirillum arcachonense]